MTPPPPFTAAPAHITRTSALTRACIFASAFTAASLLNSALAHDNTPETQPAQSAASQPASQPDAPQADLPEGYIALPGAPMAMRPPEGFTLDPTADGFVNRPAASRIVTQFISLPMEQLAALYTSDQTLAKQNAALKSNNQHQVQGRNARLLAITTNQNGDEYNAYILMVSRNNLTMMVTATGPAEHWPTLGPKLFNALLTTRWLDHLPDPWAGLGYTLNVPDNLKLARRQAGNLFFTPNGQLPPPPGQPIIVVGQGHARIAFDQLTPKQRQRIAHARARNIQGVDDVELNSTNNLTIHGLSAVESIALGRESNTNAPTLVYHLMIFDGNRYTLIQALMHARFRAQYLQPVRDLAQSYRLESSPPSDDPRDNPRNDPPANDNNAQPADSPETLAPPTHDTTHAHQCD